VIIEVNHVSKTYPLGHISVSALQDVSLGINSKEFVCIMGPSGSGKTTLLNLLGLIDEPSEGHILLKGQRTDHLSYKEAAALRRQFLGFIFQSFNLFPVLNAYENVEYPLLFHPIDKKERMQRVYGFLEELGLGSVAKHRPDELSGGQRQRVAIARALATHPLLVLADEPTANLDSASAETVMSAMQRMHQTHRTTFIFSTHDPRVMKHASRIIDLKDGRIQNDRPVETVAHLVEKHLS
jgi:putative ABC transport system ATP-binding protein